MSFRQELSSSSNNNSSLACFQKTKGDQAINRGGFTNNLSNCNYNFDFSNLTFNPKLKISQPHDSSEREADRAADEVTKMTNNDFIEEHKLQFQTRSPKTSGTNDQLDIDTSNKIRDELKGIAGNNGKMLDQKTKEYMQSLFNFDFSRVRIHDDEEAVRSAESLNASAYTWGDNIVIHPRNSAISELKWKGLLAHELAHIVQGVEHLKIYRSAKNLGQSDVKVGRFEDISETKKKKIMILREILDLDMARLDELYLFKPGFTFYHNVLKDVKLKFSGPTDRNLKPGLKNLAALLIKKPKEDGEAILPLNRTITIVLDLHKSKWAEEADLPLLPISVRFTFFGTSKNMELVVELLRPNVLLRTTEKHNIIAKRKVKSFNIVIDSTFRDAEERNLLFIAISRIPDSMLSRIKGITFAREAFDPDEEEDRSKKTAGNYDDETHTITMFDEAFGRSATAYGEGVAVPPAVQLIVHEIGHAIDLRPLKQAFEHRQSVLASGNIRAAKKAEKKLKKMVSLSGQKVFNSKKEARNRFFLALRRDGPASLTTYPPKSQVELFTEAFSFYVIDPKLMKQLRPNTYNFFETEFGIERERSEAERVLSSIQFNLPLLLR